MKKNLLKVGVLATLMVMVIGMSAFSQGSPDKLYYKFENSPAGGTTITNCAVGAPVGNYHPTINGEALGPGGQFDTCLIGTSGAAGQGVVTGWNCNLAATSWTIGFWTKDLAEPSSGNPCYLFGDAGSTTFRCFYGGYALPDNMIIRGPMADLQWPCTGVGPHQIYIVYNGSSLTVYVDGSQAATASVSMNIPTGTGFWVGGYSGGSFSMVGKMDEFRLYGKALSAAEVTASWNKDLFGCGTGVGINQYEQLQSTELSQNFPNPFNKYTTITYQLKSNSDVVLKVYDLTGKEVTTLVNANQPAGKYEVKFDATNLASGMYEYQLITNDFNQSKRMMIEK